MERAIPEQCLDLPWKIARRSGVFGALRAFRQLSGEREDLPGASEIRCERDARVRYRVSAFLGRGPIERRFTGTRRNVAESVTALAGGIHLEAEIQLRFKKGRPGIRDRTSQQEEVPGAEIARLHQAAVVRNQDSSLARG